MNPALPKKCFVPDGEGRVMPDGRLYVYGSWDISGSKEYCSTELHCFSTDNLIDWVDHGVIFRNDEKHFGVSWLKDSALFAPDAIHKDGKYYLYLCGSNGQKEFEGVAVADSPIGPFSDAIKIDIADGSGIDPTVFIDDDGQAYLFWGQFRLKGAKLKNDMATIIPESVQEGLLTEWEHGFHEGASIRKRGSKYYMLYTDISRGKATCLSYAIANSPMGPYKKCGVVIDNMYCDPQTWNNHGSIVNYKDKWYVFYHRSSQNSFTSRRLCIEEITFDEEGYIKEVCQTSQGVGKPFNASQPIDASTACRMFGQVYIKPYEDDEILTCCGKHHWATPDWAEYKYIDFGDKGFSTFCAKVKGKGTLIVRAEDNKVVAEINFDCKEFTEFSVPMQAIYGVHAIWLFFANGDYAIKQFYCK